MGCTPRTGVSACHASTFFPSSLFPRNRFESHLSTRPAHLVLLREPASAPRNVTFDLSKPIFADDDFPVTRRGKFFGEVTSRRTRSPWHAMKSLGRRSRKGGGTHTFSVSQTRIVRLSSRGPLGIFAWRLFAPNLRFGHGRLSKSPHSLTPLTLPTHAWHAPQTARTSRGSSPRFASRGRRS